MVESADDIRDLVYKKGVLNTDKYLANGRSTSKYGDNDSWDTGVGYTGRETRGKREEKYRKRGTIETDWYIPKRMLVSNLLSGYSKRKINRDQK